MVRARQHVLNPFNLVHPANILSLIHPVMKFPLSTRDYKPVMHLAHMLLHKIARTHMYCSACMAKCTFCKQADENRLLRRDRRDRWEGRGSG